MSFASHIGASNIINRPIQTGDCGILLPPDGGFMIFNVGFPQDPEDYSDAQVEQARVMMALSVALKVPHVMEILFNLLDDKEVMAELAAKHDPAEAIGH